MNKHNLRLFLTRFFWYGLILSTAGCALTFLWGAEKACGFFLIAAISSLVVLVLNDFYE